MFRRTNSDQKNNQQPADEKVRDESQAEKEIQQKVGNQSGAGGIPPVVPNIWNEAMNDLIF